LGLNKIGEKSLSIIQYEKCPQEIKGTEGREKGDDIGKNIRRKGMILSTDKNTSRTKMCPLAFNKRKQDKHLET
jgi:hypothetical protein